MDVRGGADVDALAKLYRRIAADQQGRVAMAAAAAALCDARGAERTADVLMRRITASRSRRAVPT